MTKQVEKQSAGFTLVEVVVVLAVVLLLSGIAVPLISSYVEDSRRGRAEAEVKMIAGALTNFYKDVGQFPSRDSSAKDYTLKAFFTGNAVPKTDPFVKTHSWSDWARSTSTGDILDNHLLSNAPGAKTTAAYATTGDRRWRGPYLSSSAPVDPWSRPYVVNVISAYSTDATNYKKLFVMSAGPNGVIDTNANAASTDTLGGDDIGVIIQART